MHSTRWAAGLVAALLSLAACSDSPDDSDPPPATRATVPPDQPTTVAPAPPDSAPPAPSTTAAPAPRTYSIEWEDLGGGVDGGWITVPLDYEDPQGETFDLWVTRHRADPDDRVGVLFANNGGPGLAASSMAANVNAWFGEDLIERFDIVSWDPRGTGNSGGSVDCIDDDEYDRYFGSSDLTPETDAERQELIQLSEDFANSCIERVGADVLAQLGTNNTARDMDAIRQALGEAQVSYLGRSYGSELGGVWATFFPDTVRAAVFDGAAHPDVTGLEAVKLQRLGFERVFNSFLAECSADSDCAFHNGGDAEGAFDELIASLDENPLPGPDGRLDITPNVAVNGAIQAMYSERRWPALERALADAEDGDGLGLLAFHDGYFRRNPEDGSYSDLIESFQAITCADEADRLTPDEADERADELIGIAPRLFPATTGAYTCNFFPASADPRAEITGERAGPIIVVGTTGDPSTPLDSSAGMAAALEEGALVTVELNRHTAYLSGSCIDDIIHDYLIWLEAPAAGTRCE